MFDFIDRIGEAAIERMFLNLIRGFNSENLKEAVKIDLNLLDETAKNNPKMLAIAERLAKRFQGQRDTLTLENVMGWIEDKRSDFYMAIRFNPKAQAWLKRQISEFRTYLWSY